MADLFNPITEEDYKNKGVRLLPSRVSGEAATIQRVFDELSLDVLIPAINAIVNTLNGLGIDSRVKSSDIKGIRLNRDNVIEITLNGSNWIAVSDPKGSIDTLNSNLTSYIDNVGIRLEDRKANKIDVLSKNNEEIFEPVGQYNPATKKYVDDAVFNSGAADMTKAVYDTTGKNTDIYVYADEASKIADESGNTYRFAIDNNGLYLYPSESSSSKSYLSTEAALQTHHLSVLGELSSAYKDANVLNMIADYYMVYDDYAIRYLLDGLINTGEHIGLFFKRILNSDDTAFNSLSDINSLVNDYSTFSAVINNAKGKRLIYNSKQTMKIVAEVSTPISMTFADEEFFDFFESNSQLRYVIYGSEMMANLLINQTKFLDFFFSEEVDNYIEALSNPKFATKLFSNAGFNQRLASNITLVRYILSNNMWTKHLCNSQNACNTILGNESIISLFKENISLLAPTLQYEYSTAVFKDNDEIIALISKNPNCLSNLALSGGDIDFDFYKNIQKYRANIQNTISTTRIVKILEHNEAKTAGIKGKGIIYMFVGYDSDLKSDINIYVDIEKTKLLKTITSSEYEYKENFNIVCFGTFFMEHTGTPTNVTRNIYAFI